MALRPHGTGDAYSLQPAQDVGASAEEDLREKLRILARDRQDELEYCDRLVAKTNGLKKSVHELCTEIESVKEKKKVEAQREENDKTSSENERKAKAENQEERIRDHLLEVLYAKPSSKGHKVFELDTVQVSYDKKNFRYLLAFRIDENTTIEKLRSNACKYWDLKEDDYILKTMANNKCQDKVEVKACFKQGEIAQLRLERKNWDTSEPAEEEFKAIQPKQKKGPTGSHTKRSNGAEAIDKIQKFHDNYAQHLKRMGGVYFLLKLRDSKPTEHHAKIALRDIIIYVFLAVLTFVVYISRRPEGQHFWLRQSFTDNLFRPVPKVPNTTGFTAYVPGFEEVHSVDELWEWLEINLPATIWNNATDSLGSYNTLLGYMSIRIQNVKDPGDPDEESCAGATTLMQQINQATGGRARCWSATIAEDIQQESEMELVSQYWNTVKDDGFLRGPANPGVFVSMDENARDHRITSLWGHVTSYDASGYSVSYRMRQSDPRKAAEQYKLDMEQFRQLNWISMATRMVAVSLNAYNFQHDLWMSCDLLFELPASGSIATRADLRPFKQSSGETWKELTDTYVDYIRIIIALYIFVFVGYMERKHKTKNHRAGVNYYLSLNGITDVVIVICLAVTVLWRYVQFEGDSNATWLKEVDDSEWSRGFQSFSQKSWEWEIIFVVEGVLMLALMYRMLSFLRLSHKIYLMWHSLGQALRSLSFFIVLFLPAMIGFTFLANKLFGVQVSHFSLLSTTVLELYNLMAGTANVQELSEAHAYWAIFMLVSFYIVVTFGLLNVCLMAVVDAFCVVHLTKGAPGDKWSWKKWRQWTLFSPLQALCVCFGGRKTKEHGGAGTARTQESTSQIGE